MANKIEVTGASLIVTDTVTTKIKFEGRVSDYYFNNEQLVSRGRIELYDSNGTSNTECVVFSDVIDSCVDSGDIVFTEATFRTFVRGNFKQASGSDAIAIEYVGDMPLTTGNTYIPISLPANAIVQEFHMGVSHNNDPNQYFPMHIPESDYAAGMFFSAFISNNYIYLEIPSTSTGLQYYNYRAIIKYNLA